MNRVREACPACGGNGFVDVVSERRRMRKRTRAPASASVRAAVPEGPDERGLAAMIAGAFRQTLVDTSEVLRQSVGQAFEEARLAWDRLNPEPPLSEFNNIACELGAFPDFAIGDRGRPIGAVVYSAILTQFSERRATSLLESSEGQLRVGRVVATLAGELQRLGLNTPRLWKLADTLGGAS